MPPNRFESEVESFLEGSHGDRTHIKRADHPRLHHYAGRYLTPVGRVFSRRGTALVPWCGIPSRVGTADRVCRLWDGFHAGDTGGFAALGAGCRPVVGVLHP